MIGDYPTRGLTAKGGDDNNSDRDSKIISNSNSNSDLVDEPSCLVLFTRFERLALERILGQKRSDHIFASKKATFMFC